MVKSNLELGSGCKSLGKKFYPRCTATDSNNLLKITCEPNEIDIYCSAIETPFEDGIFTDFIIANPWNYGFNDLENGLNLMKELFRLVKKAGKIYVIGSFSNKWCAPQKVAAVIRVANKEIGDHFVLNPPERITSEKAYPGYIFRTTNGAQIHPQFRITIDVSK